MRKGKPCMWNGIPYPSISACAEANDVSNVSMTRRLRKGYTCDADLGTVPDKQPRDPNWYTVEPTPTCAFCDIPILGTVYYIYRQPGLKFCSSRHAQYYALYGKDKCERRYKGRWVRGA